MVSRHSRRHVLLDVEISLRTTSELRPDNRIRFRPWSFGFTSYHPALPRNRWLANNMYVDISIMDHIIVNGMSDGLVVYHGSASPFPPWVAMDCDKNLL